MNKINNGGPAFPAPENRSPDGSYLSPTSGMSLRDWFAGQIGFDTTEIENVGKCDDDDLLNRFGTEEEKECGFELCFPWDQHQAHQVAGMPEIGGSIPIKNIELRQRLEARARAALRYSEADAMLAAREAE